MSKENFTDISQGTSIKIIYVMRQKKVDTVFFAYVQLNSNVGKGN